MSRTRTKILSFLGIRKQVVANRIQAWSAGRQVHNPDRHEISDYKKWGWQQWATRIYFLEQSVVITMWISDSGPSVQLEIRDWLLLHFAIDNTDIKAVWRVDG